MPNERAHLWSERLKLVSYCPLCETRSRPVEARVVGEDGETQLLHITCRKCHGSVLALVLVNRVGASSVGVVTDLIYDDVIRFRERRPVSLDDVLDMHEQLARPLSEWLDSTLKAIPERARRPRRPSGTLKRPRG